MQIIINETQYARLFESIDENAATDVMKKMGYKSPPDPWKKKSLSHVDATGLIGENEEELKPHTDKDGNYWVPCPFIKGKYMLGGKPNAIKESKGKEYGGLEWLKNNEVPLSDEETEYFKKNGVLNFSDSTMKLIHKGKAKDEKDGEVYFAWTHRAWNVAKTKSEAVKLGKFIESTS